jgi:hypothetical protein
MRRVPDLMRGSWTSQNERFETLYGPAAVRGPRPRPSLVGSYQ